LDRQCTSLRSSHEFIAGEAVSFPFISWDANIVPYSCFRGHNCNRRNNSSSGS